jgi:hypothetical protein
LSNILFYLSHDLCRYHLAGLLHPWLPFCLVSTSSSHQKCPLEPSYQRQSSLPRPQTGGILSNRPTHTIKLQAHPGLMAPSRPVHTVRQGAERAKNRRSASILKMDMRHAILKAASLMMGIWSLLSIVSSKFQPVEIKLTGSDLETHVEAVPPCPGGHSSFLRFTCTACHSCLVSYVLLTSDPKLIPRPPNKKEKREGQSFPHPILWSPFLVGVFASCTVQTLRVPTWSIVSLFELSPSWTTAM